MSILIGENMNVRILYALFILILCPASAQSQEVEKEYFFSFSAGNESSIVRLESPLEQGVVAPDQVKYDYTSRMNPFVTLNLKIADGVHAVSQVTFTRITEPLLAASSFTQIWTFTGGVRLQDKDVPLYLNLLGGLNMHVYDIHTLGPAEAYVSRSRSFVLDGSASLSLFNLPQGKFFVSAGARRAFHEDIGYVSYYVRAGLEIVLIRR